MAGAGDGGVGFLGVSVRPVNVIDIVYAMRGAWCVVRGAWCVVRGAWCVVRGAWRVMRDA